MAGGQRLLSARPKLCMASQSGSDLEQVRSYFHNFGVYQAPENGSPLYHALSLGVLDDPPMLEFAACCPPSQPAANLLFGAVHYLLLLGMRHPLREFYPDVIGSEKTPYPVSPQAYAVFQDFVWTHVDAIQQLMQTRLVQTNVVRRTTCLLPLFGLLAEEAGNRPLSLVEIGTSAGLNLHWDRYCHRYAFPSGEVVEWGEADSPVQLTTAVRGTIRPPTIPSDLRVEWRAGIDLNPIDVDDEEALRWLRALIFPEHLDRHQIIEAAASIARAHPVPIIAGDALEHLPTVLSQAPGDSCLCVYASMVLYQLSPKQRRELWELLAEFSRSRPVSVVIMDGVPEGWSQLSIRDFGRDFTNGSSTKRVMAYAHAHGRWLEWTAGE